MNAADASDVANAIANQSPTMDSLDLVTIRPADPAQDTAFVCDTFIESARYSSLSGLHISDKIFKREHMLCLKRLLQRPDTICLIASATDDPWTIFAWLLASADEDVLHYIYVKKNVRGLGLMTKLIQESGLPPDFEYSHSTAAWRDIAKAHFPDATHNPYRFLVP
jgi:hypothetical protein